MIKASVSDLEEIHPDEFDCRLCCCQITVRLIVILMG